MNISEKLKSGVPTDIAHWIHTVQKISQKKKKKAVVVGGVVRDLLLSRPVKEADFMLEHPIDKVVDEVAKELGGTTVKHPQFMTATINLPDGKSIDFVTSREEKYMSSAKLPVVSPASFEHDLKRRDFTINAMACGVAGVPFGNVIDPFHGAKDIMDQKIRILHDRSFEDDPTRIYRCARFAGRLQFEVGYKTLQLIKKAIEEKKPALLSPVRLRHEFEKILWENHPLPTLKRLQEWGALQFIHADWAVLDLHEKSNILQKPVEGDLLTIRLVEWLKPWGVNRAEKMMLDLAFEKQAKKKILAQLN